MRKTLILLLLAAGTVAAYASWPRAGQDLTISGATTLQPVYSRMAESYRSVRPGVNVKVVGGGTSKGVNDVVAGRSDLAGAARDLTPKELSEVRAIAVALDGLAVIVNSTVRLKAVGLAELRSLYAKDGDGRGLFRITKANGHGTRIAFLKGIQLNDADLSVDASAGSNSEMIQMVAAREGAIGYVSHADAQAAIDRGVGIRVLSVDDVVPSKGSLQDGSYKLARRLYAVTVPKPSEEIAAFLDFAFGEQGRAIIEKSGFVPVGR